MSQPQDYRRRILKLSGADHFEFLQNLVTNDVAAIDSGLVYAALLTPQGKYLADFFVSKTDGGLLLDVAEEQADDFVKRILLYRLRADVAIEAGGLFVHRGLGEAPQDGLADPRSDALGWRAYRTEPSGPSLIDWDAIRVEACIPEAGSELIPNETFPLEAGFERLSGVDFKKGCYVGQEVTARMKHKTELRKGFQVVSISQPVPEGTEILRDERSVGRVFTQSNGRAIAYLRLDRIGPGMRAGLAEVSV